VQSEVGFGVLQSCFVSFFIRERIPDEYLGFGLQTNSDLSAPVLSPGRKRQTPNADVFLGPYVVIGGSSSSFDAYDGPTRFLGVLQNVILKDIKIFSTAANDRTDALSETFLAVLMACGDLELSPNEECDASDPSCTSDCTCPDGTIPILPLGCTRCGNGIIDSLFGEVCDPAADSLCASDCSGCLDSESTIFANNRCTYCGNGELDLVAGEACDSLSDSNCLSDCSACGGEFSPTGNAAGTCFQCGNARLDSGEVCDTSFSEYCRSDCSGCNGGYLPNGAGGCSSCGDGLLDAGEVCDPPGVSGCAPGCKSCDLFSVPAPGGCSRCGNSFLDAGEVCDSFQVNCATDCSSCLNGLVPSNDINGHCSWCGNGIVDSNEKCDGDVNCVDCLDCRAPYVLLEGGACALCGNGWLDAGEVCDAAQTGCSDNCQSCNQDWDAVVDTANNPTGLCFPASCDNAPGTGSCSC